jgi:hypothetical protein
MKFDRYKSIIHRLPKTDNKNVHRPVILPEIKPVKNENLPINKINKLDIVITCVNYSDFLCVSLNENIKQISPDHITVITDSNDMMTQKICDLYGVNCVITDKFYENGAVFNKGNGINEGIKSIKDPEWILLTDADIILPSNFIDILSNRGVNQNVLYSASRFLCYTYDKFQQFTRGEITLFDMDEARSCQPIGYFQLFFYFHPALTGNEYVYPIHSKDASWSDMLFADYFKNQKECIDDIKLIHLGKDRENWTGRKSNRFLKDKEIVDLLENYQGKPFKISERDYHGEDKLCVITSYFNPANYKNLKKNYLTFRENISNVGVDLFTIELSFDGNFFIEESDKNIRISGDENNIMWQKERLLNVILNKIPPEYNNIAWVDCDVIFENPNWVDEVNNKLQSYKMLQLFENAKFYDSIGNTDERMKGIIKHLSNLKTDNVIQFDRRIGMGGTPGLAWAIRREIIDEIKFMDLNILGGGDGMMMLASMGNFKDNIIYQNMNSKWYSDVLVWSNKFFDLINKSVYYVSGNIYHLYHGRVCNRNYVRRSDYLINTDFDPENDIKLNNDNIWEFSSDKPLLKKNIKKYFFDRCEDDNIKEITLNDLFDGIFCINLDRRRDKWVNVSKRFHKNNIIVERIRAYDGNWDIVKNEWNINKHLLENKYGDRFKFNPSAYGLIENEFAYGTLCTHIEIIRLAKRRNLKRILVFEDDVVFYKDFNKQLNQLKSYKDWKLIYLGGSQHDWSNINIDHYHQHYHPKKTLGGFAYAIDSSIYDELLSLALRMEKSFDNCLGNFNGEDIQTKYRDNCYVVYPNLVIADVSDSDIREKRNPEEHAKKLRWDLSNYDFDKSE